MVGRAQPAVHPGDPAQVESRPAHLDRLLVGGDRAVPVAVGNVGRREDAQDPGLGRSGNRLEAPAHGKRLLGQRDRVLRLRHVRQGGLSADALGEHHPVVDGLEVGAGVGQKLGGPLRLRRAEVGLTEEVANPAQPERGRAALEQGESQRHRLLVPAVRDEGLESDQAGLRLVGGAGRFGKEELDGLAGPARDVLEGRQRRPGAAGFDQVDRRRRDVALAELGEAET